MKIFITTQFADLHRWKDAPEEVEFLRFPHRHMFKVRLEIEVVEQDREIEFLTAKRMLDAAVRTRSEDELLHSLEWSCETIAVNILNRMHQAYSGRFMTCEVSEDGENGAVVSIDEEGKIC